MSERLLLLLWRYDVVVNESMIVEVVGFCSLKEDSYWSSMSAVRMMVDFDDGNDGDSVLLLLLPLLLLVGSEHEWNLHDRYY